MDGGLIEVIPLLVTAGTLLVASVPFGKDRALPSAACPSEAETAFNEAAAQAGVDSLAPLLGAAAYETLRHRLAKIGIRSEYCSKRLALDVDLTHLLLPKLCFGEERKLFKALVAEGLVLVPGEAHDLEVPGHFFLSSPLAGVEEAQDQVVERLQRVVAKLHPHSAAGRAQHAHDGQDSHDKSIVQEGRKRRPSEGEEEEGRRVKH